MNQLRSTFFSMMLISSAFTAVACGPQAPSETTEPAPTTESAPAGLESGPCGQPGSSYVSHDPEECKTLFFICAEGKQAFYNECGCGCS